MVLIIGPESRLRLSHFEYAAVSRQCLSQALDLGCPDGHGVKCNSSVTLFLWAYGVFESDDAAKPRASPRTQVGGVGHRGLWARSSVYAGDKRGDCVRPARTGNVLSRSGVV